MQNIYTSYYHPTPPPYYLCFSTCYESRFCFSLCLCFCFCLAPSPPSYLHQFPFPRTFTSSPLPPFVDPAFRRETDGAMIVCFCFHRRGGSDCWIIVLPSSASILIERLQSESFEFVFLLFSSLFLSHFHPSFLHPYSHPRCAPSHYLSLV